MEEINARNNGHSDLVADAYGPELVLDDLSLDELKALGTREGIDWSQTGHQRREQKARDTARQTAPRTPPRFAAELQTFIVWVGNITLLVIMFTVANVLMPLGMLALPYAEYRRVKLGLAMFDPDNANILGAVLVVFMLGLLFVHAHQGGTQRQTKTSLRVWASDVAYFVGWGKRWKRRSQTGSAMLHKAIRWSNGAIIFLGAAGTLQDEIDTLAAGKPWREGLRTVATQADLTTMLSLIGALVITAVLLFAMQFVVPYNYQRFMEVKAHADFLSGGSETAAAEDDAARQYVLSQVVKNRLKQRKP